MPKHDHAAIQQGFVATTDESKETRTLTQRWLADSENIDRLLEVVSGGQSLRRFCEKEGISYSPVQRALTGAELEPRYRAAQEDMAEHLMGEIERISRLVEGEVLLDEHGKPVLNEDGLAVMVAGIDPKAAAVILDGLKWRITKLNQRRYSDKQVIEQHVIDHAKMHREAVRALAGAPRRPAIEGQVVRPALPATPDSVVERAAREALTLGAGTLRVEAVPLGDIHTKDSKDR